MAEQREILTLHRYYIWQGTMREFFYAELQSASDRGVAVKFGTDEAIRAFHYMSYWYAGLYVVIEGWNELRLHDDGLLQSRNVDLPRGTETASSTFNASTTTSVLTSSFATVRMSSTGCGRSAARSAVSSSARYASECWLQFGCSQRPLTSSLCRSSPEIWLNHAPGRTRRDIALADDKTVYEARYRRNGGKPKLVKLDATTKSDAIAELEALRTDHRRGDPARTRSLVPTVEEVAHDWIAALRLRVGHRDPSKRFSPRTVELYRQRIETHVVPTLGTLPIDELTVVDVRRLVDKLGRKLAPSTVTAIVSMISSLLRFAVRQRLIERNVVRDLDREDRPGVARRSEPRYLSADEVGLLLSKMTDTFRPVAMVCAYAGLRISETLGLTWADVDLAAKTINVRRQLDDDRTVRNETKSAASTAVVPMLPALERELRADRTRQRA